jgi:hypothetical protein
MYRKYFFKSKGVLSRRFVASGLAAVFSGGMFGSYAGAMQQGLNIEFVFAENEHLKLEELLIKRDNYAKEVIKFVYKFYKRHYNQLPNQNPMWALLRGDVENGDNLLNNEYFLIRLYAYLLLYKFREFKGQINIKNFLGKCDDNKFREYFDSVRNFFRDDDDGGKKSKNLLKEIKNGWGRGLLEEVEKEKDLEDFIKENYKEGDYVNLVPDKEKILDMILSQEEMQKVRSSGSLEDFKDLIPEKEAIISKIFNKFYEEQECARAEAIKEKFLKFLSKENIEEWIKKNLISSFPELSKGLNDLRLKSINSNEKNIKKPLEDLEKTKSHKLRNTIIIVAAVAIIATVITAISLNLGKSKTNTGVPNNNNNNKDDEKVKPPIDLENPLNDSESDDENLEQKKQEQGSQEQKSSIGLEILKVIGTTVVLGTFAGVGAYSFNEVSKRGKV